MNFYRIRRVRSVIKQTLLLTLCGFFLFYPYASQAKTKGNMLLVPVHIEKGISLIRLVKEYCTSKYHWKEIAKINDLAAPYRIYSGDTIRIPLELLKKKKVRAKVVSVIGDVFYVKGDGAVSRPVKRGDRIRPRDMLMTGKDGFAIIALPDNRYIRVSSNSQFVFTYLFRLVDNSLKVEFLLERGDVSVDVQQKLQENETFRTRTPACTTGVRGTFYRVKVEEDTSIIETLKGKVVLFAANVAVTVKEGMGAFVMKGVPPAVPQALPAPPAIPELKELYRSQPFHLPSPSIGDGGHARLRICMDKAGKQTVWRGDAVDGSFVVNGLADGTYYAFFTAVNAAHLEGKPTAPVSFMLRTVPAPPLLSLEYDGTPMFGNVLEFGWKKGEGDTRYLIQVAADESFTDLLAEKETSERRCLFANMAEGSYYFRVRAIAADGFCSGFSRTGRVILKEVPTLQLLAPLFFADKIVLRWSDMGGDISYDIEIATDDNFSEVIGRASQLQHATYQPKSLAAGRYWVRVRAGLPTGEVGAWAAVQELVVPAPRFGLLDGVLFGSFVFMLLL